MGDFFETQAGVIPSHENLDVRIIFLSDPPGDIPCREILKRHAIEADKFWLKFVQKVLQVLLDIRFAQDKIKYPHIAFRGIPVACNADQA